MTRPHQQVKGRGRQDCRTTCMHESKNVYLYLYFRGITSRPVYTVILQGGHLTAREQQQPQQQRHIAKKLKEGTHSRSLKSHPQSAHTTTRNTTPQHATKHTHTHTEHTAINKNPNPTALARNTQQPFSNQAATATPTRRWHTRRWYTMHVVYLHTTRRYLIIWEMYPCFVTTCLR